MVVRLSVALVSALLAGPLPAQVASHASALATQPTPDAFAQSPAPIVTGKPVARVNGVAVTDRDLLREMYTIFPYARQHNNGFPKGMEAEIRKGALQMIIFEELVYQEAQRKKMTISAERLNRATAEFRQQFPSPAEYQNFLKAELQGSEQLLKQRIRRSLLIDACLKAEVQDKSSVSQAEAKRYYDQNPARFAYKESFAFQSISIMPPANANAEAMKEARQRAEDALRQAKATKNYQEFGLLAEKISEDDFRVNMGDHKAVEREQLPPAILKAVLSMQPGQVSDLIQLDHTFTVFRLNSHLPAGARKFGEVQDQLRKELQKEKEDRVRIALDQRLRKNAKVEEL